jgi:hypothetical protein
MYACSPEWKGWISEVDLEKALKILAGFIQPSPFGPEAVSLNHGLHFTGGEPFLKFDLLKKAVILAHKLGIPSTFVETNAYWCTDENKTKEKLAALKACGLQGILISVNPFYLEYVPFERTERCIRIAHEVFYENMMVYQTEYYNRFKRMGLTDKLRLEDYLRRGWNDLTHNVEMFLMGKAVYKLRNLFPKYPSASFLDEPCVPPFLRNWHNHFDNYGNYMPGYCGGLSLGSWRNLNNLVQEAIHLEKFPILKHLVEQDMEGLLRMALDYGYSERVDGYISKCDLCVDMRKFLCQTGEFGELKPKAFYSHLG